jgi:hypothetical protein
MAALAALVTSAALFAASNSEIVIVLGGDGRDAATARLPRALAAAASAPSAPRSPVAAPGDTAAKVTWQKPLTDNGSPIDRYVVKAYVGGTESVSQTFPSTATTQTVTNLVNGTAYTFRVAAGNGVGVGPLSDATAAVVVGAPVAPTGAAAVPGNGSATVRWTAPATANGSPITGYVVTPYLDGAAQPSRSYPSTATSQAVSNLLNGRRYTFRVAARNARGVGPRSAASSPIVVGAPTPPRSVTASAGTGSAEVAWAPPVSANGSAVTGYVVAAYSGGVLQLTRAFGSTATSQQISPLTNGRSYTFRVAARNARGTGPWSAASTAVVPREDELGSFRVECEFSHRAQVDPIVAPGTQSAHVHDFFGNDSTSATSTYDSMRAGDTTCSALGDLAGYWAPTLLSPSGTRVMPERSIFYYRNRPVGYRTTTLFPRDFRMIAGGADKFPHTYWTCDGESDTSYEFRRTAPPNCNGRKLKAHVFFPSCWDGVRLDSPDHRSHVAYGRDDDGRVEGTDPDTCPATHPVKLPQLDFRVLYPITDGRNYRFSDGTALMHADFWNTWTQSELQRWVRDCLWAGESCGLAED